MITLKEWMEVVDYRITEGSDYHHAAFGDSQYSLSAWNGDHDGWSFNIVFDTEDQTVFMVEACDYKNQRAYRRINPDYKKAHDLIPNNDYRDQAWDEVNFIDLETDDDWIQKSLAIKAGESYDTRVEVPLDLDNELVFEMMKQAHERDITLNQYAELLLRQFIDKHKDSDSFDERMWKKSLDNVG
mgnify:CR=1 FL=1